jgi:hypothetical protein
MYDSFGIAHTNAHTQISLVSVTCGQRVKVGCGDLKGLKLNENLLG